MGGRALFAVVGQNLAVGDDGEASRGLRHRSALGGGGGGTARTRCDGTGSSCQRRRSHQNCTVGAAADSDEGDQEVIVGQRREKKVLRRSAFEMVVDVEHSVPAILDGAPAGIFAE